MSHNTDVLRFLSGGIGALVPNGDGSGQRQGTNASPAARPEETKPEPQLKQTESFLNVATQPRILVGTAILVAAIGLLALARR